MNRNRHINSPYYMVFLAIWCLELPEVKAEPEEDPEQTDISTESEASAPPKSPEDASQIPADENRSEAQPKTSHDSSAREQSAPENTTGATPPKNGNSDHPSNESPWVEAPSLPTFDAALSEPEETQPNKGPRYLLEKIEIKGNRKTITQVILNYIEITPGEIFSVSDPRLEKARYRLLAEGLFHSVEFSLKRGSKRGWAVLVVRVKERNTIVVQDIVFGFSEIPNELSPYGSLDVAERSFLGTGIKVSLAAAISEDQYGYRLRISDDHFLNTDFAIRAEGLFSHAIDFFGKSKICYTGCTRDEQNVLQYNYDDFATLKYNRGGMRLGTGYTLLGDNYFSINYRFELIDGIVPIAGSHVSFGERRPIAYGHLLPGHSILSSLILGVVRDTRDSFILASKGYRTAFEVEISSEMIGSDYDFSKFTLVHDTYFPLPKNQSIRLSLFTGLIMGDAPFFNQFFVGDFSAFVPSRVLELNFSHLQPNLLETTIAEMRYEDLALSIGVEYSIPFYRGHGFFYGVNGFVGLGVFALASRQTLRTDPKGYKGFQEIPMDLTADIGIKVDTAVGLFVFSLANLFRLIPSIGDEAAEE